MDIGFRFDIDGVIAEPKFHELDFWATARKYIAAGFTTEEEVCALHTINHQRVWLLPQVLLTHTTLPGAVEGLQHLAQFGTSLGYVTVRQALDSDICKRVHENTCIWLANQQCPVPGETRFFWDAAEKLPACLEAPETVVALIDDRPAGLLRGYQKIVERDAQQAEEIRKRVILVAFGCSDIKQLPDIPDSPRVIPFANWLHLSELLSLLEGECTDHSIVSSVPKEGTYGDRCATS